MPEDGPHPVGPALEQILDEALRPIFGNNVEAYHDEVARHHQELRDIPGRIEQSLRAKFDSVR